MRVILTLFCLCLLAPLAQGQTAPLADVSAKAAVLMDADTGEVLRQKNPDLPLPPASATKIMTAWLLARSLPPDSPISVSEKAAHTPETTLGMKPGQNFAARDLLYAMLLASANDASVAAAEAVSGTETAFIAQMNEEARSVGAANTYFVNPNGLPDPSHVSTARDLALITRKALQNPAFAAAVATRTYTVPARNGNPPQLLTNTDTLLTSHPEITGVKTGWTREAGYCFVGSATVGGKHYITVVLNSAKWQADTIALLQRVLGVGCRAAEQCSPSGTAKPANSPVTENREKGTGDREQGTKIQSKSRNYYVLFCPLSILLLTVLPALYLLRGINMPKLRLPAFRRPAPKSASPTENTESFASASASAPAFPTPDTRYPIPVCFLARGSSSAWLDAVFANPARLLEPATRYRAAALLDANGKYDREILRNLLNHTQANLQVAGAELLHPFDPKAAEARLTDIADDPEIALESRAEAFRVLAETGGDRHEMLFRQTLLREGLPAAAFALRSLPELTNETINALRQALKPLQASDKPAQKDLKAMQQKTAIACVFAEHGALPEEITSDSAFILHPSSFLGVVCGENAPLRSEWAVSQSAALALSGKTAAIKPLLNADPETVHAALERLTKTADAPTQARASALRWLLFQEGDAAVVRKMAEAGDETARTVLQMSLLHHANLSELEPEAALAAAQIVSLRLGFSHCPPEQISALFRTSASGEPDADTLSQNPELSPLARAYARPDVHQSVQNALEAPDGLEQLAAELTRRAEHPAFQSEIAFWADKTDRATRLPLVRALSAIETDEAKTAVMERLADCSAPVRRFALKQKAGDRNRKLEVSSQKPEEAAPVELDAAA